MYGHGYASYLGIGVQTDKSTPADPSLWVPLKSESIKTKVDRKPTGSLYGKRTIQAQLQGIREPQGGISLELLPNVVAQMLSWWNGIGDDVVPAELPYLTIWKMPDNDTSVRVEGFKLDKFTISASNNESDPVEASFEGMGMDFSSQPNPANPAPVFEQPSVNWQATLSINGTQSELLESFSVSGSNGLAYVPGLRGVPHHRDVVPNALRAITGTVTLGMENQDQFRRLINGTAFSLVFTVNAYTGNTPALRLTLPHCYYTEAGGSISGPARITEALPFVCAAPDGNDIVIG